MPKADLKGSASKDIKKQARDGIRIDRRTKRGKVFLYTSKRKLVPVRKKEIKSKQLREDKQYWKEKGLLNPPFDPDGFVFYYESNGYFMSTVDRVAQDVAGQGYYLKAREGVKADKDEDGNYKDQKIQEFKDKVEKFLAHPNDKDQSIEEIVKRMITNWGVVGWWNLELVRNTVREVTDIYNCPAQSIKVHESGDKYCQTRYVKGLRKRVWFKRFGIEDEILAKTGEKLDEKKKGEKEADDDQLANEMIMDLNYYLKSDFYGAPNILGSLGAVLSLIGIRDFNLSFFENYGVPAALVILHGKWEEGSEDAIMEFIDTEIKGSENAHKTLALLAPEEVEGVGAGEGKKSIEWIPLITKEKEGSFLKEYYRYMRDEVLMSYFMPAYRIGIYEEGRLGGTGAPEATKNYVEAVVKVLQNSVESVFNNLILPTLYDKEKKEDDERPLIPLLFKLRLPDTRNIDAEIKHAAYMFDRASLKVDEFRAIKGLTPLGKNLGGEERYIKKTLIKVGETDFTKDEDIIDLVHELEEKIEEREEGEGEEEE